MIASSRYGSKVQLHHLKNGDITYYIVYKLNGKVFYKKVGRKSEGINEAKAVALRNQILSDSRHGIDLSQKSYKYLTFDNLAMHYFNINSNYNKSNKKYQQMYILHIKDYMCSVTIANLDDNFIYRLQSKKLKQGLSNSTINIIVKLIRTIINFGLKQSIIPYNPFRNIKLFKINNDRLRYLSLNEIKELEKLVDDDIVLKLFVKLSLNTGARANSILAIAVKDIDFDNKTVRLNDFKRNSRYVGYLDDETIDIIKDHTKDFKANNYIVSLDGHITKYQQIYISLTKIFDKFNTNLNKSDRQNRVVIHTLRHTFASHLAIAGVPIQKIQKLMNHKDINQTLKYAKLSPDSGRDDVIHLYKDNQ